MVNRFTSENTTAQEHNRQVDRPLMYVTDDQHLVCYRNGAGYGEVLMPDGTWLAFIPFDKMPEGALKVRKP